MPPAPAPKRKPTVRRLAAIRMSELYRLAEHRHRYQVPLDAGAFCFVLAATLATGGQDGIMHTKGFGFTGWSGLDVPSLHSACRQCGLPEIDDDALGEIVTKATAWRDTNGRRLIGSEKAAALLGITAEERWACRIGSMGAIDDTPAERKARQAAAETERSTKRRRAAGAKPHADSARKAKPWESEGISRASYYRRQARGPPNAAGAPPISETISTAPE